MHNYVMFANPISQDAFQDIDSLDRLVRQIVADVRQKDVEVLTLVVQDTWDTLTLTVYEQVLKAMMREAVLVEGYLEGHVNLAALDLFSTMLVDDLRMSPSTKVSIDKMDSEWVPKNPVSSLLWLMGSQLPHTSAEDVTEVYRDTAMNDVRLTLDDQFLSRIVGDQVFSLSHGSQGWSMRPLRELFAA